MIAPSNARQLGSGASQVGDRCVRTIASRTRGRHFPMDPSTSDEAPNGKMPASNANGVKVILLGDAAAGKSKLIERFLLEGYVPHRLSTYAVTIYNHTWTSSSGREVPVVFWDTAGQEKFNKLHPSYYYQAHACVLVFDVTRKLTYKNLERWHRELLEYCENIPTFVVANKIDVDYKVTSKSFNFATKRGLPFFFVSASDGTNVVKMFNAVLEAALKRKEAPPDDYYSQVMDLLQEDGDVPRAMPDENANPNTTNAAA